MKEYLRQMEELNPNQKNLSLTVVDGPCRGEKCLLSGGKPVWYSKRGGFLERNESIFNVPEENGLFSVDKTLVYAEFLGREKQLLVLGSGHVGLSIIRLGKMVGMHVIAVDDRESFTGEALRAGADEVFCGPFEEVLEKIPGSTESYFVIVTRGHRFDEACLRMLSRKKHAYIGMMGSARRAMMVKETLREEGIDEEILENLHTPIGLKIQADTPEEIAVSVLAEIIAVKNRKKTIVIPEDVLKSMKSTLEGQREDGSGRSVLCTIIRREGSAPREVGSRMLVLCDGRSVNTIGGGLLEARTIRRAREMCSSGEKIAVLQLEMNTDRAAEEGEVCGGCVDILLEMVENENP